MAIFPKVQSPCPYKGNLSDIMDGETCRLCKRQVFDLSEMSDGQRVAFMKGCTGEVCVSYKFRMGPVAAAAVAAIAAVGLPTAAAACETAETMTVVVGGIKDPANAEYVRDTSDASVPGLPVAYESDVSVDQQQAADANRRVVAATIEPNGS